MRALMKIFCPVVRRTTALFFIAALLLGHAGLRAGEFDIIINELNYNVFDNGGEDSLEFIELYNRGGTVVDLGGWDFSRGVDFTFSAGTMVEPGEYLVLSPDPAAAAARSAPGVASAVAAAPGGAAGACRPTRPRNRATNHGSSRRTESGG